MKKIIFILVCIAATMTTIDLNAQNRYKAYCSITFEMNEKETEVKKVFVDFGQEDLKDNFLINEKEKALKFSSIMGALNYMAQCGWELDSFTKGTGLDSDMMILSKNVSSEKDITKGFRIKRMKRWDKQDAKDKD